MPRRIACTVLLAVIIFSPVRAGALAVKPERSPHAEALELVFVQRASEIRTLDAGEWWLDTKERTWRVKRPFGPGGLDSTHSFDVEYLVDGRSVGHWFVDTRSKTVQAVAAKERSK